MWPALVSPFTRHAAVAGGVFLLCLAGGAWLYQRQTQAEIRGLRADVIALETMRGEVTAANAAQQTVIEALRRRAAEDDAHAAEAARRLAAMAARNRHLEHSLREAADDKMYRDFQYSRAVSHALCLRWLNAEDRLPGDDATDGSGTPSAGRDDSVAAFCAAWPQLTAEEAVIYIGDLIDHAGRAKARTRAARGKE